MRNGNQRTIAGDRFDKGKGHIWSRPCTVGLLIVPRSPLRPAEFEIVIRQNSPNECHSFRAESAVGFKVLTPAMNHG